MLKIAPVLIVIAISACHTSNQTTTGSTDDGGPNGDGQNSGHEPTQYEGASKGGQPFADKGFGLIIDGEIYQFIPANTIDGQIYEVVSQDSVVDVFFVYTNEYMTGVYLAHAESHNSLSNFTDYGWEGVPVTNLPTGRVDYLGKYTTISGSDHLNSNAHQEVRLSFDYSSGIIEGGSVQNGRDTDDVVLNGLFFQDEISLNIFDDLGAHHATGQIFGENAEAFVAVYTETDLLGVIHAQSE